MLATVVSGNFNSAVHISGKDVKTDSLRVSSFFGKEHYNVVRDINSLDVSEEFGALNFNGTSYFDERGKEHSCYEMTKNGFLILAMGYQGKEAMKIKEAYIKAFDEMEQHLYGSVKRRECPIGFSHSTVSGFIKLYGLENAQQYFAKQLDINLEEMQLPHSKKSAVDSVKAFSALHIEEDSKMMVHKDDLYTEYEAWCKSQSILAESASRFFKQLRLVVGVEYKRIRHSGNQRSGFCVGIKSDTEKINIPYVPYGRKL